MQRLSHIPMVSPTGITKEQTGSAPFNPAPLAAGAKGLRLKALQKDVAMIRYALKCTDGHAFESWFQSGDAFDALAANPNVVAAVTAHGGHLGWCDAAAPCGPPSWLQENALDFLDVAALDDADRAALARRRAV